jgi:hypothetical protein
VLLVLGAVGARRIQAYEAVPVPRTPRYETMPDNCTVTRTCTFSRLVRAPSARRLARALVAPRDGLPVDLGREWDGIDDGADRAFLADVLRGPRSVYADATPETLAAAARYDLLLGVAWAAEVDRQRARIADRNSAARLAYLSAVSSQRDEQRKALLPTGLELAALLGTLGAALGIAAHRRSSIAVEVDRNGVRISGQATEWRDVDALDWYDGSVELRRVDGGVLRYDGLLLRAATVDAIEVATARFRAIARDDDAESQRLAELHPASDEPPPWLHAAARRAAVRS